MQAAKQGTRPTALLRDAHFARKGGRVLCGTVRQRGVPHAEAEELEAKDGVAVGAAGGREACNLDEVLQHGGLERGRARVRRRRVGHKVPFATCPGKGRGRGRGRGRGSKAT